MWDIHIIFFYTNSYHHELIHYNYNFPKTIPSGKNKVVAAKVKHSLGRKTLSAILNSSKRSREVNKVEKGLG